MKTSWIFIFSAGKWQHVIDPASGITTDPTHQPTHHQHHLMDTPENLLGWAQDIGPATTEFVKRNLQERRDFANGLKKVSGHCGEQCAENGRSGWKPPAEYALERDILTFERLRSILKNELYKRTQPPSDNNTAA